MTSINVRLKTLSLKPVQLDLARVRAHISLYICVPIVRHKFQFCNINRYWATPNVKFQLARSFLKIGVGHRTGSPNVIIFIQNLKYIPSFDS